MPYNQQMLGALRSALEYLRAATVTGMPLLAFIATGMNVESSWCDSIQTNRAPPSAGFQSVSPDYFKTFGIQVLKGRSFSEQDTPSTVRVAVVNDKFERRT